MAARRAPAPPVHARPPIRWPTRPPDSPTEDRPPGTPPASRPSDRRAAGPTAPTARALLFMCVVLVAGLPGPGACPAASLGIARLVGARQADPRSIGERLYGHREAKDRDLRMLRAKCEAFASPRAVARASASAEISGARCVTPRICISSAR